MTDTPKGRRDRLLKKRPFIRPLQIFNETGDYHKDVSILWAAHLNEPLIFLKSDLTQNDFAEEIETFSKNRSCFIIEDNNESFDEKRGPVSIVSLDDDGWRSQPRFSFFKWATKRNKLRVTVCFLQWLRYKNIGVILVWSREDVKLLFSHCEKYGVLHFVGRVPNAGPSKEEYLFSMRGRREV